MLSELRKELRKLRQFLRFTLLVRKLNREERLIILAELHKAKARDAARKQQAVSNQAR